MEAVRKRAADTGSEEITAAMGTTNRKMRELREVDLKAISMYRHQTKHEDIAQHLTKFITREVNVRLMPGYVEFFEFLVQNPYPEAHSISIACNDDELRYSSFALRPFRSLNLCRLVLWRILVNGNVWRDCLPSHRWPSRTCSPRQQEWSIRAVWSILKSSCKEKNPFTFLSNYKRFLAKIPPSEQRATSNPHEIEQTYSVVEKNYNHKFRPKQIKVRKSFLRGQRTVKISIRRSFSRKMVFPSRYSWSMWNTCRPSSIKPFVVSMAKILYWNVFFVFPTHDEPSRPVRQKSLGNDASIFPSFFRITRHRSAGTSSSGLRACQWYECRLWSSTCARESTLQHVNQSNRFISPPDVDDGIRSRQAASHNAPTVNSFLVFMYSDGFLHKPINVWQLQIHAVKRLDLTCILYQTTTATLLLRYFLLSIRLSDRFFCCSRGRNASRLVQCFSNAPDELALSPSNAFAVAANGLHEMHLLVHPSRSGFRTYTVNGVDVENHQVVDTWMIKVDTRMPVVSKQFGQKRRRKWWLMVFFLFSSSYNAHRGESADP